MADKIYSTKLQDKLERNTFALLIMLMVLLSVGGLVEPRLRQARGTRWKNHLFL